MNIKKQIKNYIDAQHESKTADLYALHDIIRQLFLKPKLWFLDGKDADNKVVSNPNIGYGNYFIAYANGEEKPFYQIGVSANTSGISVYIMGIKDRKYLPDHFGKNIGKATVTGYCIKFKSLADVNIEVMQAAMRYGLEQTNH